MAEDSASLPAVPDDEDQPPSTLAVVIAVLIMIVVFGVTVGLLTR